MTKKFERMELKTERTLHFGDSELLLAFQDDAGAYAFEQWWDEFGAGLFGDWCANNPDFQALVVD